MFGKSERQIKDVKFVQLLEGEPYFYAPIAYTIEKEGKQVFLDSGIGSGR
jgi:hypothetical protein